MEKSIVVGNGRTERRESEDYIYRSKQEEYRMIADLTGFDNLRAMMEAEAFMRRKSRRKKKRNKNKNHAYMEFPVQYTMPQTSKNGAAETVEVLITESVQAPQKDAPQEHVVEKPIDLEHTNKDVETVEVLRTQSVQTPPKDVPQEDVVDATKEKEQEHREMTKVLAFGNELTSAAVIELSSSSSENDGLISKMSSCKGVAEMKLAEKEKKDRKEMRKKRRKENIAVEYSMISDLNGFENLKAMLEAEVHMRRKKKKRKIKKQNNRYTDFQVHEEAPVDGAIDKEKASTAVERVEVLKSESIQIQEEYSPPKPFAGAAREMKPADAIVEVTRALAVGDGVNTPEMIDLSLPSSEDDGLISNMSSCNFVAEMVPTESFISEEIKKSRKEDNITGAKEAHWAETDKGMEREQIDMMDNTVLSQLLRKPRYFDNNWDTCFRCGQERHMGGPCPLRKRKKPCFLCGSFEHTGRHCRQRMNCFVCKGRGHLAKNCPDRDLDKKFNLDICLRCGDSGHDMFSCRSDYPPDDLKEIQCYMCKNFGHLCCGDFPDIGPTELSCYNCGQSGHLGLGCTTSRGTSSISKAPAACNTQEVDGQRTSNLLSPVQGLPNEMSTIVGSNPVPRDLTVCKESVIVITDQ